MKIEQESGCLQHPASLWQILLKRTRRGIASDTIRYYVNLYLCDWKITRTKEDSRIFIDCLDRGSYCSHHTEGRSYEIPKPLTSPSWLEIPGRRFIKLGDGSECIRITSPHQSHIALNCWYNGYVRPAIEEAAI